MTQEIRPNSARDIIERIFGDCPKEEKDYYEERLRTRYGDAKLREKLPPSCYRHESPPRPDEGILFNHQPADLTYWENLLHLDKLLKKPSEVFKVLDLAVKGQHANMRTIIKARRDELKLRLSPLEDLLEESAGWENIPDHFLPDEARLINLPASTAPPQQTVSRDAWKAKTIEKITQIEATDAWQSGDPEATAEKANLYIKIGAYALAYQQVETGLVDHPKDPALHYVKACILLNEMHQNRHQALTHHLLHQESTPLSGEEEHHAEQAFEQATIALKNEESALIQLMSCYRYCGSSALPNWAHLQSSALADPILFKIIELADRSSQRICETYHWDQSNGTERIEETDSSLSRDIIHFFTQGTVSDKVEEWWFYSPNNFGTLIRYWALMQRIKPLVLRKSVKRWRKVVEEAPKRRRKWEWFTLNENDAIRADTPWNDEWPQLISYAYGNTSFTNALTEAKVPAGFLKKINKALAEHQADHNLWQRMVYEWRCLSRIQEQQHQNKHLAACKRAKSSLPWSKTAFSAKWKTRWVYAEARCQYNAAIRAWPDSEKARVHINKVEQLLKKHPEIESLEHTHLTIHQYDECSDWEADPLDLIGNTENIFTSTKANKVTRHWGIFSYYNPSTNHLTNLTPIDFLSEYGLGDELSLKSEVEGPLERHHAFAEACSKFEGSLYEKAQQLFQYKESSTS